MDDTTFDELPLTPKQTAVLLRAAERLVLALDAHRCPACGEPRRKLGAGIFATVADRAVSP